MNFYIKWILIIGTFYYITIKLIPALIYSWNNDKQTFWLFIFMIFIGCPLAFVGSLTALILIIGE